MFKSRFVAISCECKSKIDVVVACRSGETIETETIRVYLVAVEKATFQILAGVSVIHNVDY